MDGGRFWFVRPVFWAASLFGRPRRRRRPPSRPSYSRRRSHWGRSAGPKDLCLGGRVDDSGYLLTLLVIAGGIKGIYDILLLIRFQKVRPPEEAAVLSAQ
jgi:hypothetical protein